LEHFFRWITRQDSSFWSADFFYPAPLTIAFSDNFLGDAFVYALFRAVGFAREDAFRLWYLAGFVINFGVANYALVRLGSSRLAAAFGAFLFAFGLPVTAQEDHVQLVYRFGVPLAVLALEEFRSRRELLQLTLCAFWTTWQLYCSIYTGYFLTLVLFAFILGHILCHTGGPISGIRSVLAVARLLWLRTTAPAKAAFLLSMAVLAAAIVLLCLPYFEVSRLYGFRRGWSEISEMLPRPASYLLANNSRFWPNYGPLFDRLPMRQEHAMFIGIAPFMAVVIAVALRLTARVRWDRLFVPTALAIVLLMLLTLSVDGHSAYRVLVRLPGANAIRAVTRIITILLFPWGMLLASSLDTIIAARLPAWVRSGTVALIGGLVVFEASYITHYMLSKQEWQARMEAVAAEMPPVIPQAPILLLAPKPGEQYLWPRELDAMLFAQDHGWRTLNGYSGNTPPEYGTMSDCQDAARALVTGIWFRDRYSGQSEQRYDALASQVITVGFPPCDDAALPRHPRVTVFGGAIQAGVMANVTLRIDRLTVQNGQIVVVVSVANASSATLPAISATSTPIRLSTRFIDTHSAPPDLEHGTGWDSRQDINFDIPPGTSQQIAIHIAAPKEPGSYRVAVSMVQDGVAWFHDHGLHIPVSAETIIVNGEHLAHVSDGGR
jgi:hypothetical protein